MAERAANPFGDVNEPGAGDFSVADFKVQAARAKPVPEAEAVRVVAEASNFPSREAGRRSNKPASSEIAPARRGRRMRTGRNIQMNIKVGTDTQETLYAVSDSQGWALGETLDRALKALQRELGSAK